MFPVVVFKLVACCARVDRGGDWPIASPLKKSVMALHVSRNNRSEDEYLARWD